MKRRRKVIVSAVIALSILGGLFVLLNPSPRYMRRHWDEGRGFDQLHTVALEMLSEEGPGVVQGGDGQPHIESYEAFYNYVKAKRPSWVAGPDAPNPFRSILSEVSYGHLAGKAV